MDLYNLLNRTAVSSKLGLCSAQLGELCTIG